MTAPIITVFVILVLMVIGFASQKFSIPAVAISVIVALNVTGILSFEEAWAGYTSSTALLFAAMFVLSAALAKTSLLAKIAGLIVPEGSSERRAVIGCGIVTIILSILGNTSSAIATMMPIVFKVAEKANISPKRILKPLVDISAIWIGVLPIGIGITGYSIANDMLASFGGNPNLTIMTITVARLPITLIVTAFILLFNYKLCPQSMDNIDYSLVATGDKSTDARKAELSKGKETAAYIIYGGTILTMILSIYIRVVNTATCAVIGALLMVFFGVINTKDAFKSINLDVISIYAGTLALAAGLSASGAIDIISTGLQNVLGGIASPFLITAVLYMVSAVATQFLNNTSASNIFLVIGVIVTVSCGFDSRAVLGAVMLGAVMPGVVPMASATESMIFAQGGYTMKEYFKAGILTFILYSILTVAWVSFVFPAV